MLCTTICILVHGLSYLSMDDSEWFVRGLGPGQLQCVLQGWAAPQARQRCACAVPPCWGCWPPTLQPSQHSKLRRCSSPCSDANDAVLTSASRRVCFASHTLCEQATPHHLLLYAGRAAGPACVM